MKRLFVRPAFQGHGWARVPAERMISEARGIGYSTVRLDTLPFMHGATWLYESLGFERRSADYDTPLQEGVFMELQL